MERYRTDPGKKEQGKVKDTEYIKRENAAETRIPITSTLLAPSCSHSRKKQRPVGTNS